jgi:hypothetical protein
MRFTGNRFTRKLAGLVLASLMATGAAAAIAAPAHAATAVISPRSIAPYYQIVIEPQGQGSNDYLCLQGDLGGPLGSTVTQQDCHWADITYTPQLWQPISLGGGIYKFQNVGTGRCLEARQGAFNGAAVDLWPCESSESNERWYWPPAPVPGADPFLYQNPIQTRVSGSTGFCLDVPGAQTTRGLQLQVWRCNGTSAQNFFISNYP